MNKLLNHVSGKISRHERYEVYFMLLVVVKIRTPRQGEGLLRKEVKLIKKAHRAYMKCVYKYGQNYADGLLANIVNEALFNF